VKPVVLQVHYLTFPYKQGVSEIFFVTYRVLSVVRNKQELSMSVHLILPSYGHKGCLSYCKFSEIKHDNVVTERLFIYKRSSQ